MKVQILADRAVLIILLLMFVGVTVPPLASAALAEDLVPDSTVLDSKSRFLAISFLKNPGSRADLASSVNGDYGDTFYQHQIRSMPLLCGTEHYCAMNVYNPSPKLELDVSQLKGL